MTTIKRKMDTLALKGMLKLSELIERGITTLKNNDGAITTVEILIWVLVVGVIASIIAGLIVLLVKNEIFPMFSDKLKEIFNMK